MDEIERGFGGRAPRRQRVYPFHELDDLQVPLEEKKVVIAESLADELL